MTFWRFCWEAGNVWHSMPVRHKSQESIRVTLNMKTVKVKSRTAAQGKPPWQPSPWKANLEIQHTDRINLCIDIDWKSFVIHIHYTHPIPSATVKLHCDTAEIWVSSPQLQDFQAKLNILGLYLNFKTSCDESVELNHKT